MADEQTAEDRFIRTLLDADTGYSPADFWCSECHGQGGWEESGEDVDFGDSEWVTCHKCGGEGQRP